MPTTRHALLPSEDESATARTASRPGSPSRRSPSATADPGSTSRRSSAENTTPTTVHLVSHRTACTRCSRCSPEHDGRACRDTAWPRPAICQLGGAERAPSTLAFDGRGRRPPARDRARAAMADAARQPHAVHRHLPVHATRVDGALRLHQLRDRIAVTGSPCCTVPSRVERCRGAGRGDPLGAAGRRRRRLGGRSPSRRPRSGPVAAGPRSLRRGGGSPRGPTSPTTSTPSPPGASPRTPAAGARRLRRCGRRRSRRAASSTRERVLMSKHWMDKVWSWDHCFNALALAPGTPDAALDQFLAPFDHQDDERCAARLRHPLRGALQLRQAAHPRLGAARACATADARSTGDELDGDLRRPGPLDQVLARRTAGAPGTQLPYYQHGNDSGWDNATTFDVDRVIESPTSPPSSCSSSTCWPTSADELDRPSSALARQRGRAAGRALLDQLWTGTEFVAGRSPSGRRLSTATACSTCMPLVLGERPARATSARRWPTASRTTSPRTAWPPSRRPRRTTRPTATGAARSGRRPPPSSRTGCGAAGSPRPRGRRQRPVPRAVRDAPGSPRTSTPAPARACATAPTPGPPPSTSSSPRLTPSERADGRVQKRHPSGSTCPAVEAGGAVPGLRSGGSVDPSQPSSSAACEEAIRNAVVGDVAGRGSRSTWPWLAGPRHASLEDHANDA